MSRVMRVVIALFLAYSISPILVGYHVGYNANTDQRCLTRVGIQWCK